MHTCTSHTYTPSGTLRPVVSFAVIVMCALCCADVGKTRRLRSAIIQNSHNPVWNQRAIVYVADEADDLTLEVKVKQKGT